MPWTHGGLRSKQPRSTFNKENRAALLKLQYFKPQHMLSGASAYLPAVPCRQVASTAVPCHIQAVSTYVSCQPVLSPETAQRPPCRLAPRRKTRSPACPLQAFTLVTWHICITYTVKCRNAAACKHRNCNCNSKHHDLQASSSAQVVADLRKNG